MNAHRLHPELAPVDPSARNHRPVDDRRDGRRRFLRQVLALPAAGLLAACGFRPPFAAPPLERVRRIGILNPATRATAPAVAFVNELRGRGWVEGQNLTIEWREAEGRPERYRALATEIVRAGVEVIVAQSSGLVDAAKAASPTIPIVSLALPVDPVAQGWAVSLAHPSRTVTGTVINRELEGKRVDLLREVLPGARRVGILWSGRPDPSVLQGVEVIEAAARGLGLEPIPLETPTQAPDVEAAFAAAAGRGADALVFYQAAVLNPLRMRIIELAAAARLPTIYPARSHVAEGGLMSYGPDFADLHRRTARLVDEILRGALPADLPIQQPTTFELVINLKTADALGLTIPTSVRQQATETIQ